MSRAIADTSIFIARESGRPVDRAAVPEELAVSVVTIGELHAGVLEASDVETRDRRLLTLTMALSLDPVPIGEGIARVWARLRLLLREAGRRMPVNDSWIAATAMALDLPLVTQDADYVDVEGLTVIRV